MEPKLVFNQKYRVGAWVAEQVEQSIPWCGFYAMGVEIDGEIVAGVVFDAFNGANCTVHIAIARRGRFLLDLFSHVCEYAFNQCKMKRITGMVPASKPKVLAFDLHLGFREEFVMQDAAHDGGPLHILVMRPDDAQRWLQRGK